MATTTQTYGNLTAEQKTFYDRTLLSRLLPNLTFLKYGQKRPMPKNEGDTINFRRFNSLDVPAASLTEGVTPDGDNLSITAVTATVAQEGNWVRLSDKISMVGIDPVLTESAALMGENAAKTLETRCADVIFKGTSQQFAGGAASAAAIAAGKVVNSEEIKKAVRTLRNNNAEPLEGGYYIGFCDPSVAYDLQNDSLWQDISKYNGAENIMKGEIGRIHGVRFILTTMCPTDATTATAGTLHKTLIVGKDAYGVVDVNGSSKPEIIIKPTGSAGTEDPLNQRASVGWKAMAVTVRLQELAMVCIQSMASA
jgi:N4-gp56 family major capsid protein|uniref:Major capsid protein n=1 Tax=Myoviridae sp. ctjz83 TaxID=2826083 RepID=A0A8D9UHB3_9CAUD|nr:MAG TPA: major capsid protein [Myoviridae sp. ctjz83]DAL97855.1 MAG TPA: major capsid protein [Caudoviricetes sp.]DAO16164.1 MAG TPA: major capsid protein [Caudoviricetes sp.]DAO28975.1 MAG TPA: major capsid protein [Caudoviricetes sp.]DAU83997.1 MAG TPA: major capsid protein [Caudoviricetes sp.]